MRSCDRASAGAVIGAERDTPLTLEASCAWFDRRTLTNCEHVKKKVTFEVTVSLKITYVHDVLPRPLYWDPMNPSSMWRSAEVSSVHGKLTQDLVWSHVLATGTVGIDRTCDRAIDFSTIVTALYTTNEDGKSINHVPNMSPTGLRVA